MQGASSTFLCQWIGGNDLDAVGRASLMVLIGWCPLWAKEMLTEVLAIHVAEAYAPPEARR